MLQWKEIDNQAFGVNSSLQQQQQLHVRGICVLAACNPEGPDLHWGPNNNQNQSGGSRSSSHRETHRDTEREREREDSAVGELFVGSVGRRRVVCRGRGREAFSKCAVERICL